MTRFQQHFFSDSCTFFKFSQIPQFIHFHFCFFFWFLTIFPPPLLLCFFLSNSFLRSQSFYLLKILKLLCLTFILFFRMKNQDFVLISYLSLQRKLQLLNLHQNVFYILNIFFFFLNNFIHPFFSLQILHREHFSSFN